MLIVLYTVEPQKQLVSVRYKSQTPELGPPQTTH